MADYITISKSYKRCVEMDGFLDRFYAIFIKSSPRIEAYFTNTDFARQKQLLEEGLELLLMCGMGSLRAKSYVSRIGVLHSRGNVDVPPDLYPLWVDSMLRTVKEFDPEFDADLEAGWRDLLAKGIDRMAQLYDTSASA